VLTILEIYTKESKQERADPVSALYERGEAHHVGTHAELEEQMTTWDPLKEKSPDRLDAVVYAVWYVTGQPDPKEAFREAEQANAAIAAAVSPQNEWRDRDDELDDMPDFGGLELTIG
jgi:hypothetical protein